MTRGGALPVKEALLRFPLPVGVVSPLGAIADLGGMAVSPAGVSPTHGPVFRSGLLRETGDSHQQVVELPKLKPHDISRTATLAPAARVTLRPSSTPLKTAFAPASFGGALLTRGERRQERRSSIQLTHAPYSWATAAPTGSMKRKKLSLQASRSRGRLYIRQLRLRPWQPGTRVPGEHQCLSTTISNQDRRESYHFHPWTHYSATSWYH